MVNTMLKLWNKFKLLRNYLAFQIFSAFILIFTIILSLVLSLPYFDARVFNPIEQNKLNFFHNESLSTQLEYNLDEIFRRNLFVNTPNNFEVILFEPQSNAISGLQNEHINPVRAFIFTANNPFEPLQRRFDSIEIYGPFVLKSSTRNYYQYFIDRVTPQQEFINHLFDYPVLMFLLILLICSPLLVWLSWRIAKPVKALRLSADAVATGNLMVNRDLETKGIQELRHVGKSFNRMITALQKITSYQQRLLSDISHELKTPLTRMQLAVSLIRRRSGESSELTRIENEIEKLNTMILDLLSLSRQQVNHHLHRQVFPIHKIWEEILTDAQFEVEQNGLLLNIQQFIKKPMIHQINGNVSLLSSAVENVIRNAKKYADKQINVTIDIENTDLIIIVDDDGAGIPDDQYEEIFRPFYRIEEDRARQTGGTGLGLSIVFNAVQQHKGTVSASRSPIGGLRIQIQLPLWKE